MTSSAEFSRPGAVDLSSLRQPAAGQSGTGPGSGAYVVEIASEAELSHEVVNRSMSVVVLLSIWAPDVEPSVQINNSLARLSDEYGGRFVLATLDARAQQPLVTALGIPNVPLVVAVLRGQLAPLFAEPLPDADLRALLDQILQAAAANGVSGVAEPRRPVADSGDSEAGEPPARYPEAEQALISGDVDAAVAAYSKAVDSAPADPEARTGLARAKLLQRTRGVDVSAARKAAADRPDDIAAQTLVADLDVLGGHVEDAFARLIDLVRSSAGADRDAARTHLIGLFTLVGDADPRVVQARQRLASALF